ncbi:MAG: response regulator transcription factor [bacterium]|nr:response regulator transcription factor [bacterium]
MKDQNINEIPKLNVLVVDDHPFQCSGLRSMLLEYNFIQSCDKAFDGEAALSMFTKNHYDFAFVDVEMPGMNGMELSKIIRRKYPFTKIIVLTGFEKPEDIGVFFDMGVSAYLLKCYAEVEIAKAFVALANGEHFISEDIQEIYDAYIKKKKGIEVKQKGELTKMETKIVTLMCDQLTSEQISYRMGLSKSTIDTYRKRIFKKLKIVNSIGIAIYAFKNGLFNSHK